MTVYGATGTKLQRKITNGLDEPVSLAFGSSGFLNVANEGAPSVGDAGSITEYAPGGSQVKRKITNGIYGPLFVAFGP